MLIDLMGSNCSGKSSIIQAMLEKTDVRHIDLRNYLGEYMDGIMHSVYGFSETWRNRRALRCFLQMICRGESSLALRYASFYSLFCRMAKEARRDYGKVSIIDEGVIKKLYEAVPFVDGELYERELRRWERVNAITGKSLLGSVRNLVDVIVYLYVEPKEYLKRVKMRAFFTNRMSEGQILGRYLIQCKLYGDLIELAQDEGIKVITLNSTNICEAIDGFREIRKTLLWEVENERRNGLDRAWSQDG